MAGKEDSELMMEEDQEQMDLDISAVTQIEYMWKTGIVPDVSRILNSYESFRHAFAKCQLVREDAFRVKLLRALFREGKMDIQHEIVLKILNERAEQERLKAEGRFKYTCADLEMSNSEKAVVLVEEVGEVCRAVLESNGLVHDGRKVGNYAQLQKELIQVAAVAVAWLEALKKSNVS